MGNSFQDFELLSFIWARYPYKLSRTMAGRRFLIYTFTDDPDSTLYQALVETSDPTKRANKALDYQGDLYEAGVGFITDIDALSWRYVNLFLLQEWFQAPTPASQRIPDEAWAIAENILEFNPPPTPMPIEPADQSSGDDDATGDDADAADAQRPNDVEPVPVKVIAEEIQARMAALQEAMRQRGDCLIALENLIAAVLTESAAGFVADADEHFAETFNSLWQSLFALVIVPVDATPLLPARIVLMLRIVSLVGRVAQPESRPLLGGSQAPGVIRDAARATPVLPAAAFPLPPPPEGATSADGGWLAPMAVGELKRVHQTLRCYGMGEIAHIETVLRGEVRDRTTRRLKVTELTADDEIAQRDVARRIAANRSALADRDWSRSEPLGYHETKHFSTDGTCASIVMTPGQPSGSAADLCNNGGGDVAPSDGPAMTESANDFAQEVTERSASEIRRRIKERMHWRQHEENEETDSHSFDNRNGVENARDDEGNIVGIYRWINKIYTAELKNDGKFLLLEVIIPSPAQHFLGATATRETPALVKPVPPWNLDPDPITSYQKITADNYAGLAIRYGVKGVAPPPVAKSMLSATFRGQPLSDAKTLDVPGGYTATLARMVYVPDGSTPTLLIGGEKYSGSALKKPIPLAGETSALLVQVVPQPPSNEAGGEADAPPSGFFANVEVECALSDAALAAWQVTTYEAILAGYETQLSAFEAQFELELDRAEGGNPARMQAIERLEIKSDALRMLLSPPFGPFATNGDVVDTSLPAQPNLMMERYLQLFDQALDWREMVYTLYPQLWAVRPVAQPKTGRGDDVDSAFLAFLDAAYARLILPVTPGYEMILLLYIALGGRVWVGGNETAPVAEHYMALADDLKTPSRHHREDDEPVKTWSVTMPTSLVTLQDGSALPDFDDSGGAVR